MDIEKIKLHEKLVALLDEVLDECDSMCNGCGDCQYLHMQSCVSHKQADHLIAAGVTVKVKKEEPPVDLTNKCGSCKHSVVAEGVFGDSTCYVRCTNKEHLSGRHYQEHPIAAVRQRTARACKKYEPRSQLAEKG